MGLTPTPKSDRPPFRFGLLYILIGIWLVLFITDFLQYNQNVEMVPYSQFLSYVREKKVAQVTIGSERIQGTLKQTNKGKQQKEFATLKVDDPQLTDRLSRAGIKFSGLYESKFWQGLLAWMVPIFLFFLLFSFLMKRAAGGAGAPRGGGFLSMGKSKAKIYVEKGLKVRFDDVAGVDEGKEELREIVNFLKDPARYTKLGGRMPKGILLVGPPGTGKTLLAKAVAGEAGVPFFSINGSEFVELFVGLGAARVRDLFEQARNHAPCILFIDELDALGKARGLSSITGSGNDEKEQTLNQLLAEMDGFDTSKGIVILSATNRPEVLDPALLRAGRFDRHVVIDKPDRSGRAKILEIHMKKVTLAKEINSDVLSSMTAGFSGADLANLVNEAALIATRRQADAVEMRDFTEAVERIVAGLERKSRLLGAKEKRRVAYHEMGHAVVALATGETDTIHKVSIIPRGIGALGYTMQRPTEDRYLMGMRELENKLAMMMGGRAAEAMFFDDISTG
ncbi:MAG: cell division protein FtsH, partial [Bdellovibrionales bacterium GWB1_55_8]